MAKQVLALGGASCFAVRNDEKSLIAVGDSSIVATTGDVDGTLTLYVDTFDLSLTKDRVCIRTSPYNYLFPGQDVEYGVVLLSDIPADKIDEFDSLLKQRTTFRDGSNRAYSILELPDSKAPLVLGTVAVASGAEGDEQNGSDEQITVEMVLCMPHTKLYTIQQDEKELIREGDLTVLTSSFSQLVSDANDTHSSSGSSSSGGGGAGNGDAERREEKKDDGDDASAEGQAKVFFLSLGSLKIALTANVPCLRVGERSYVLPSTEECYGIVLSAEHVDAETVEVFELMLAQHTAFHSSDNKFDLANMRDKEDVLVKYTSILASGLESGSQSLARGIVSASSSVSSGIHKGSEMLKTRIKPDEKEMVVSLQTQQKLAMAKAVGSTAVTVSKGLLTGAMATASMLSTHISDAVAATSFGKRVSQPDGPRQTAAKQVAKSAIVALARLYESVEQAGLVLLNSTSDAAVGVIGHKYGASAGSSAEHGFGVIKDLGAAAVNMRRVGVRAVAGRSARYAAVDVLSSDEERKAARASRPSVDPAAGLQAVSALSSAAAAIHQSDGRSLQESLVADVMGGVQMAKQAQQDDEKK